MRNIHYTDPPVKGPVTIRFVRHQPNCGKHEILDPHWVDVYTGISWVEWHPQLFKHLRSKRR